MIEDLTPDTEQDTTEFIPIKDEGIVKAKKAWSEWAGAAVDAKRRKEGSDPAEDKKVIQRILYKLLDSSQTRNFEQNRQILKKQMEIAVASGDQAKMIEVTRLVAELPDLKIKQELSVPLNEAMNSADLEGIKLALQDIQEAQLSELKAQEVEPPQEASV